MKAYFTAGRARRCRVLFEDLALLFEQVQLAREPTVLFLQLALMPVAGKSLLPLLLQLMAPPREHTLGHAKSSRAIWATVFSLLSLKRTASSLNSRV
jgi:hypothetical protein